MRDRWESLKQALREMFSPRYWVEGSVDDEADATTADVIARWVGDHRHSDGWVPINIGITDETDRKYAFNGDEADDVWVDKP